MEKQKTLIFLLSAMLFLTASFLVYSWNEPTGTMPGTYSIPLNTSGTAQTKTGELTVPIIYDSEGNGNYYLNPSGSSKISSITSDLSIQDIDSRDTKTLVTKEYLDFSLSELNQTITETSNMFYVSGGLNPTCPEGTTLFEKKWLSKTCTTYIYPVNRSSCYCDATCSTTPGWTRDVQTTPTCLIYSGTCRNTTTSCSWSGTGSFPAAFMCTATNWDAVICVKNSYDDGTPLLANEKHTSKECTDSGGEVVEDEDGVKFCKFNASSCPTSSLMWRQYKNWSTTASGACHTGVFVKDPSSPFQYSYGPCPGILPYHEWGNIPMEGYSHYFGPYDYETACNYYDVVCAVGNLEFDPPTQIIGLTGALVTHVGCY